MNEYESFIGLMYLSQARIGPDQDSRIYLPSRIANRGRGISGTLHRDGDVFVQYIEGPETAVRDCVRTISTDRRHRDMRVLIDERIDGPVFDGWSMAYTNAEDFSWSAWAEDRDLPERIEDAAPRKIQSFLRDAVDPEVDPPEPPLGGLRAAARDLRKILSGRGGD